MSEKNDKKIVPAMVLIKSWFNFFTGHNTLKNNLYRKVGQKNLSLKLVKEKERNLLAKLLRGRQARDLDRRDVWGSGGKKLRTFVRLTIK